MGIEPNIGLVLLLLTVTVCRTHAKVFTYSDGVNFNENRLKAKFSSASQSITLNNKVKDDVVFFGCDTDR